MPKGDRLGEFEQLALLAVMRLGADAHGAAIQAELEETAGRDASISAISSGQRNAGSRTTGVRCASASLMRGGGRSDSAMAAVRCAACGTAAMSAYSMQNSVPPRRR